jgi:tRNA modification GTPase
MLLQCVIGHGAVLAEPGAFSKRAFLNDKLDLAQAEAIADLINASSKQAARCAVRSLSGVFSERIQTLLKQLIHLRMMVEAAIDFAEEEIDFLAESTVIEDSKALVAALSLILKEADQGRLLQEGLNVVIAGPPNAGKSSLMNRLCGEHAAIVTDIPGTTRDTLKEYIELDGLPLHIIDTAGLRESEDIVEQEGIRRAHSAAEKADLVLLMLDATMLTNNLNLIKQQKAELKNIDPDRILCVFNKMDLLSPAELEVLKSALPDKRVLISAKTEHGLDKLLDQIKKQAGFIAQTEGQFIARKRHITALNETAAAITRAITIYETQKAGELLAEELLIAQNALSQVTGEYRSDDLLGAIFSEFCVGK